MMKAGVKEATQGITGKTITGVLFKPSGGFSQVLLVFSHDTYYEFYASPGEIKGATGISQGGIEAVRQIAAVNNALLFEAIPDQPQLSLFAGNGWNGWKE
jgi:hypothetical protein